jgi:hypothetical protein
MGPLTKEGQAEGTKAGTANQALTLTEEAGAAGSSEVLGDRRQERNRVPSHIREKFPAPADQTTNRSGNAPSRGHSRDRSTERQRTTVAITITITIETRTSGSTALIGTAA